MDISVIVPARDAQATLPRTLDALARQEFGGEYEVLVVDDGSRDATAALAREAGAPVRVLSRPAEGPGAARNFGAARSSAPALAFCDADVYPAPGWLSAGLAALSQADVVQGRVLPDPETPLGPFDRTIWVTEQRGLWESANLFATRALFARVGGFTSGITPRRGKPLAEDVYFGYGALRLGARSTFAPEAVAYHAVFPRKWPEYVAERVRLRHFPAMARAIPEMRDTFLYRHVFLDHRSARFDLALAGLAVGASAGSALPLVLAYPYLRLLYTGSRRSRGARRRRWGVGLADLAADAVGFGAMAYGSARERTVVL